MVYEVFHFYTPLHSLAAPARSNFPDAFLVFTQSHLGRYLGADRNGKVSCDSETEGEENAFQVEATPDGRWAIKSSKYNRYFGGSDDNLSCYEQTISSSYLWAVHLAMHPQVCHGFHAGADPGSTIGV